MTALEFIIEISSREIRFSVVGGDITFDGPANLIAKPRFRDELRRHKADLLTIFSPKWLADALAKMTDDERDLYNERAAIREESAGFPRAQANALGVLDVHAERRAVVANATKPNAETIDAPTLKV